MTDLAFAILNWLPKFAAGITVLGGALAAVVAFAYYLFRRFASKWLDAKFEEQLADYRHRQTQEIERLRFQIASLMDRLTKLNAREFEVLPEAWRKLSAAISSASAALAISGEMLLIGNMGEEERELTLGESPLHEFEKVRVRAETGMAQTSLFKELNDGHVFRKAMMEAQDFHNYIILEGIFLEPTVRQKFRDIDRVILPALNEYRWMKQDGDATISERRDILDRIDKHAAEMRDEIFEIVSNRLWQPGSLSD